LSSVVIRALAIANYTVVIVKLISHLTAEQLLTIMYYHEGLSGQVVITYWLCKKRFLAGTEKILDDIRQS